MDSLSQLDGTTLGSYHVQQHLPPAKEKFMHPEKASVLERLEAYDERFESLLTMLSGALPLSGEAKIEAQKQLKCLKADLDSESREMHTNRGQMALNEIEKAYYAHVIHQTSAEITVAANTIPNENWHGVLYGARISITIMIHQLRGNPN